MRLWSIHPSYLDTKGLTAVWREGLLALHVLRGQTKGYTQHPQLLRFKNHDQPLKAITFYLHAVVDESEKRNFSFQRQKLEPLESIELIEVTVGQLLYETKHLKKKLFIRDQVKFEAHEATIQFNPHPLFKVIPGEITEWERVNELVSE